MYKKIIVSLTISFLIGNISETILAERNFLDWDFGNSGSVISHEYIHSLPYRSLEEILTLENGVVEMRDRFDQMSAAETELHVRGGREYENAFYLNGVNVTDPISGIYTAGFNTRAFSSIEFYSGGFPAQFGNANSSVINMSSFGGGEKLSGFAEAFSDNEIGSDFDKNHYLLGLDGPIPITENLTFFGLIERRWLGDRYPSAITESALPGAPKRLPSNWLDSWTYHGKINYSPSDGINLTVHVDGSNVEWSEYLHSYYFNSPHTPYHDDDNLAIGVSFEHEIIPDKTKYSLGASFFRSERFMGDGVYRKDLWSYGRPNGNYGTDITNLFYYSDQPGTPVVYNTVIVDGQPRVFVTGGDEGHVYSNYVKHKADVVTVNGAVDNKFSETHFATLGFEYKRHTIRYYQHLFPTRVWQGVTGGGIIDAINYGYDNFGNEIDNQGWENATKRPVNWSVRFENKLKFEQLEIIPAVRLDYFNVDALVPRNLALPLDPDSLSDAQSISLELSDMEEAESYLKWSPRLSIRVPISERTSAFSNFGVYYQMPPFQYLYNDYNFFEYKINTGGYFVINGNAGLEPIKTQLFEAGISHRISQVIGFSFVAYVKETENQIQVYNQPSIPTSFATYRSSDDSRVEGFETEFDISPQSDIEFHLSYTWTDAKGAGSNPNELADVAWVNVAPPTDAPPLIYDQRHRIVGIASFDFTRNKERTDVSVLDGLRFNIIARLGSGQPYTPIQISNEATLGQFAFISLAGRNSVRTQWNSTIDFSIEKTHFIGGIEITPFAWVTNLFDNNNVANVWKSTGEPNTTGWLETPEGQVFVQSTATPDYTGFNGQQKYEMRQQAPDHYFSPRQFFFGLRAGF